MSDGSAAVLPIESTGTKNYVLDTARGLIALEGMGLPPAGFNTRVSRRPTPRPLWRVGRSNLRGDADFPKTKLHFCVATRRDCLRSGGSTMRTDASDVAAGDTPGRDAPMNRKPVIDHNLVVDGLLFATPGDRCRYLGTSNREKPRWLEENKGRYRYLDDVEQESTQLGRPDNVEVAPTGPNCGTSSRDIRKDGGDDDNSSLVRTLPEHRSPPHQPTSVPAHPVNENVPSGSTHTEVQPRAMAAATETIGPKSETDPPGATGRNRDRSGSRQLGEQEQPARISKSARKR